MAVPDACRDKHAIAASNLQQRQTFELNKPIAHGRYQQLLTGVIVPFRMRPVDKSNVRSAQVRRGWCAIELLHASVPAHLGRVWFGVFDLAGSIEHDDDSL